MFSSLWSTKEPGEAEKVQLVESLGQKFPQIDAVERRCWLKNAGWSLKKAEKYLAAHVKWRQKHVPHGHIRKEDIEGQLATDKVFLQGCDSEARPILVVLVSRHVKTTTDDLRRLMIYAMDGAKAAVVPAKNPAGVCVGILDLRGLRYENLDVQGMTMLFQLLADAYPERLALMVMLGAPSIFWGLWRAVLPFISADLRARVHFVAEADAPAYLRAFVPPEVLPDTMGGSAPLKPVAEAVEAQRAQQGPPGAS